jgi:hypothetical protein
MDAAWRVLKDESHEADVDIEPRCPNCHSEFTNWEEGGVKMDEDGHLSDHPNAAVDPYSEWFVTHERSGETVAGPFLTSNEAFAALLGDPGDINDYSVEESRPRDWDDAVPAFCPNCASMGVQTPTPSPENKYTSGWGE